METDNFLLKDKIDNGILRLTLNNSKHQNTLSDAMMKSLKKELSDVAINESIRVVILAANGPIFCAGHDLKEITEARNNEDLGYAYFEKLFNTCSELMQLIVNNPKPIIAEVNGIATAAGCQLVASCDLAIGSDKAKFATPGVNIGLFCSTPMVALSRNISNKHAMEMLLTGEMIDAKKAKEIGLINNNVSSKNLMQETLKLAKKVASKSSMTLKVGKHAFYAQSSLDLSEAYKYTSKVMLDNILKDDAKEGIDAFINKRDPEWKDK
jgi:enoyl-CoA hydratase/carnithine racemase|tara:strand:+ start:3088 stop:3888 length:801 start_codon:yes stop_codon:yes gene_type:complete